MRYLLLLILLIYCSSEAQTYKTVDEKGNVVYTDVKPSADAKPIEINTKLNITPGIKLPDFQLKPKAQTFSYKVMELTSPSNDLTINGLTDNLPINVRLFPNLNTQEGHSLQILVNNNVVAEGSRTGIILEEMDRGTHIISAQIVDENKRVLISAAPVSVHVQKHSALNKP